MFWKKKNSFEKYLYKKEIYFFINIWPVGKKRYSYFMAISRRQIHIKFVFNTYYFTIETFKKQNKFVRNEAVDFDLKL